MPDYIPRPDAQFNDWQVNFTDYLSANAAALGVGETEIKELLAQRAEWEDTYRQCLSAQAAATSAREAKDTSRNDWQGTIRSLAQRLQASKTTTDAQRAALGITVPDRISTPAGAPTSRPSARIENRGGLRHTVNFVDENTPTRTAKPAGVMGAEIWVYLGDAPPADSQQMHFLGLDTSTPYEAKFEAADAGKTAYYRLRWVNRQGEAGDWGAIANAVVMD
jgi:hypothetical protein